MQGADPAVLQLGRKLANAGLDRIAAQRKVRDAYQQRLGCGVQPLRYVIVASGNIYEDVVQARVAARQGADIIAVIRSTGQSLLDYVPEGATTEGFGGTFATQDNFRLMRAALDEVGEELGRCIRLCNYASGLCMPEIACMGAFERLDMMLNDALYGILFRDINMRRTLCDQRVSRRLSALAGLVINTGEDNYLTTADAIEALWAEHMQRKIGILGACTGDDAHTVGIDAILNVKGCHGEKGQEAYKCFEVKNLGAQVSNDTLLQAAREFEADAILVSQVVTQKDCHRSNLAALIDLAEAEGLRAGITYVCGGPRLSHAIALELGSDAGFGAGTTPTDVASFLVQAVVAGR